MPITRRALLAVGLAAVGLAAVPRLRASPRDEGITGQELQDAKALLLRESTPNGYLLPRAFVEEYMRSAESGYVMQQFLARRGSLARSDAITALGVDPYDRIIHAPNVDALWLRFNGEDVT